MSREGAHPSQVRRLRALAVLAGAACLACLLSHGCGRQPPDVGPPAQSERPSARSPAALREAVTVNLRQAEAAVDRYEAVCRRAEALGAGLGREGLTAEAARQLVQIAEEADEALHRLDSLVAEQSDLIQEAAAWRSAHGESDTAERKQRP